MHRLGVIVLRSVRAGAKYWSPCKAAGGISSRMGPPAVLCMAFIRVVQRHVDVTRVRLRTFRLTLVAAVQRQVHQRGLLSLGQPRGSAVRTVPTWRCRATAVWSDARWFNLRCRGKSNRLPLWAGRQGDKAQGPLVTSIAKVSCARIDACLLALEFNWFVVPVSLSGL